MIITFCRLIPKGNAPNRMRSNCNVSYKIIVKVFANNCHFPDRMLTKKIRQPLYKRGRSSIV
jgi:hypothetical protein